MKKIFLLLAGMFVPVTVFAQPGLPRFLLNCAVVQHSLKGDQGACDELLAYYQVNPKAAGFIADFWTERAKRDCLPYGEQLIQFSSKQPKKENSNTETFLEEIDQCQNAYYFDHWDDITSTIRRRISATKNDVKASPSH